MRLAVLLYVACMISLIGANICGLYTVHSAGSQLHWCGRVGGPGAEKCLESGDGWEDKEDPSANALHPRLETRQSTCPSWILLNSTGIYSI